MTYLQGNLRRQQANKEAIWLANSSSFINYILGLTTIIHHHHQHLAPMLNNLNKLIKIIIPWGLYTKTSIRMCRRQVIWSSPKLWAIRDKTTQWCSQISPIIVLEISSPFNTFTAKMIMAADIPCPAWLPKQSLSATCGDGVIST